MKKLLLLSAVFCAFAISGFAQETMTLDELKALKSEKEAVVGGIASEIAAIDKRILEFPGWVFGAGILFGVDFAGQNNWYAIQGAAAEQQSQAFSVGLGAFGNYNTSKYYWRNNLGVNWGRTLLSIGTGNTGTESTLEIGTLDLTSMGGYFIWQEKLAASARAKWSTVLFDLSPGSITASAGLSYLPIKNMELWVHPLAYQYNYPGDEFTSATGASFGGSYTGNLLPGIAWTSTLEGFYSYVDDADAGLLASDLHNWTWTNGFTVANLWKGVGVGLSVALRQNRQLANFFGAPEADWGNLQSQYNLGFAYSITQ